MFFFRNKHAFLVNSLESPHGLDITGLPHLRCGGLDAPGSLVVQECARTPLFNDDVLFNHLNDSYQSI